MPTPETDFNDVLDQNFDDAFNTLEELIELTRFDEEHPVRENAVYRTSVVLWMLAYQRLNPDHSLEAAVKKLLEAKPQFLPDNKRLNENTLSPNTGAFSKARKRLPVDAATSLLERISQTLIDAASPSFEGRRVFLIDGTTLTLAPTPELQAAFPPAVNQFGPGVWPIAQLVLTHELASGTTLVPQVGTMFGENAVSETTLVGGCIDQLPDDAILMADPGFGIFWVAWQVHHRNQLGGPSRDFVFRLSKPRFESLRKKATEMSSGSDHTTYELTWRPSAKDRKTHPELPADAAISVRLHEIRSASNPDADPVYLVTMLRSPAVQLSALYQQRVHIEVDIRNVKVVLGTEDMRCRSESMFRKELMMSMVAYNLVVQFRRQCAELAGEPPRRMSFKRTWTTFCTFLLSHVHGEPEEWRAAYRRALKIGMSDKLPNRPGRSYPRETYPRRPKSNQFKKRKPKPKHDDPNT